MKQLHVFLAAVFLFAATGPALATQEAPGLVSLFADLKKTKDPVKAENLQQAIWQLWIESEDKAVVILFGKSREVLLRKDYVTALDFASKIVQLAPNHAEGWNLRATIFYAIGDYDSSIADAQKALTLEPRHFGALVGLGMMYLELGREDDALAVFKRALALNPHLAQARQQVESLMQPLEDGDI